MRSKSNAMVDASLPASAPEVTLPVKQEQETTTSTKKKKRRRSQDDDVMGVMGLSQGDLLTLLGIMEGEVQAREDVIRFMACERSGLETTEPGSALRALRRDGLISVGAPRKRTQPMVELESLQQKHRETYRRMRGQLDLEKRQHADYMTKSDEFTNLLEQERERLKQLLEVEKAQQASKEQESSRRLTEAQEDLAKLRSFALMLVEERRLHLEQMEEQGQRALDLEQQLQRQETSERTGEDGQQNRQLPVAKLPELSGRRVEDFVASDRTPTESENGWIGENSTPIAEQEELAETESRCQAMAKKLQEEDRKGELLRLEVEKLQVRMADLDKLEAALGVSKAECARLNSALDGEKGAAKVLSEELVALRIRTKEIESTELRLEKSELSLKDDLGKLKALTSALMDERRSQAERLRSEVKRSEDLSRTVDAERRSLAEVTQKLMQESEKYLKMKSELGSQVETLTDENRRLRARISNGLDGSEKAPLGNGARCAPGRPPGCTETEDKKLQELTSEMERLRKRLKQLEADGAPIKAEDRCGILGRKLQTEQVLSRQIEGTGSQIAPSEAVENGEGAETASEALRDDVLALKEKLVNEVHRMSRLQADHSLLQRQLEEAEEKAENRAAEVSRLTAELERRRPTVAAVTTEEEEEDLIPKSTQEENQVTSDLRQKCLRKSWEKPSSLDTTAKKSWIPWMRKKETAVATTTVANGDAIPAEPTPVQKRGRPVPIRVTPENRNSTATLEISNAATSPEGLLAGSIPLSPKSKITIVPSHASAHPRVKTAVTGIRGPDRAKSPVAITAVSRAKSPDGGCGGRVTSSASARPQSPPSAISCLDQELTTGRVVFKITPEKQTVPAPVRKRHDTDGEAGEEGGIRVLLGNSAGPKMVVVRPQAEGKEVAFSSGTVLRSPRQIGNTANANTGGRTGVVKASNSITITPVSTTSRSTQNMTEAHTTRSTALTRIPMSKSLKTGKTSVRMNLQNGGKA